MTITNIETKLERLYERHGKTKDEGEAWTDELLARQRLAAIARPVVSRVGSVKYVQERMAKTIAPTSDLDVQVYNKSICHGWVALKAKERHNPKDKIWIYGQRSPEQVWHSVLTDQNNELLTDSFRSKGFFMEHDGYMLTDGEDAEMLELMLCISVGDLIQRYQPSVYAKKEHAFGIYTPMKNYHVKSILDEGDDLKSMGRLTRMKTNDPRVELWWRKRREVFEWFFFLDEKCVGQLLLKSQPPVFSRALNVKLVLEPHVVFSERMRGKGYASFVYQLMLRKGFALMTEYHTKAASDLWERVAQRSGARIAYLDLVSYEVLDKDSRKRSTAKVLIPRK